MSARWSPVSAAEFKAARFTTTLEERQNPARIAAHKPGEHWRSPAEHGPEEIPVPPSAQHQYQPGYAPRRPNIYPPFG